MLNHCPVTADLNRYLREEDVRIARAERLEELTEEHYRFLTEDVEGIRLITENIYFRGNDLDREIFKIFKAWSTPTTLPSSVNSVSASGLCSLIEYEASVMAREWAEEQLEKEEEENEPDLDW